MKAQTSCKKSVYDADRSRFNRAWNRGKDASRIFMPLADDRSETCFVPRSYSNSRFPVPGVGWSTPLRRACQGCKKGEALAAEVRAPVTSAAKSRIQMQLSMHR